VWLIYIRVRSLEESIRICQERGGKLISEAKGAPGGARYCMIEDPAGAPAALIEMAAAE
jgi:hypothetical protein